MAYGLFRIVASVVLILGLAAGAQSQDLDPERASFDPEIQFVITPFGAILGDPAQLTELGSGRTGYTYCSTAPDKDRGLLLMASIIIPAQDGADGGGHAMMMTVEQARNFLALLRKAPDWARVAAENKVGLFSKPIGDVIGAEGEAEHLSIRFVSDDLSRGSVRIEHVLGGVPRAFGFGLNAAQKFAAQAEHALDKGLAETPAAPPDEDAEKSKLFE
ncbi:MAG: hypothetical protein KUA43_09300 [Hoeflea sp.]|uniref:hypothetical protein n=1 Tax=Hoeflea sp. TaxID=1940281 RepID=UPI001DC69474|nr:hypothetical protein [Hoeflea sp.]MBU4528370.1 hypothetical protein [Alphaproteobacteria bacterium]MBU4543039.1 hypothetical protein [Alphaproteobacteria bacterium]MBU4551730.1 hypothetical protein [Alphaproteobacteria bacterium]MBV1723625.1 hypothetical protein [Hoeflea sp.]MBV1761941.1 hypothetical protein [Hoeflea sp.]